MKKRNLFVGVALGALHLVALAFLVGGCETESATQTDIQVRPAYSELRSGESVALTVSGWSSYRWTLPSGGTVDAYGFLSAGVGERVVYTVTATPSNGYSQVISVAADVRTESVPGASGSARVKHVWSPGDTDPDVPPPDVKVTPTYTELEKGQTVTLRATGWTAYRWRLADNSTGNLNGRLSAGTGDKVVYTAELNATEGAIQVITVSADGSTEGNYQATATVKHK